MDAVAAVLHAQVASALPAVAPLGPSVRAWHLLPEAVERSGAAGVLEGALRVQLQDAEGRVGGQELRHRDLALLHALGRAASLVRIPVLLRVLRVEHGGELRAELPGGDGADQVEEGRRHAERSDLAASGVGHLHGLLVVVVPGLAEADDLSRIEPVQVEVAAEDGVAELVEVVRAARLHDPGEVLPAAAQDVRGLAEGDAAASLVGADLAHEGGAVQIDSVGEALAGEAVEPSTEDLAAVPVVRPQRGEERLRPPRHLATP